MRGWCMPLSLSEPLPAMLRRVSERKIMMATRTTEEMIRRKMKIARKLKELARAPPRTGPMAMLKLRTASIQVRPTADIIEGVGLLTGRRDILKNTISCMS
jgi:hypothetical protein